MNMVPAIHAGVDACVMKSNDQITIIFPKISNARSPIETMHACLSEPALHKCIQSTSMNAHAGSARSAWHARSALYRDNLCDVNNYLGRWSVSVRKRSLQSMGSPGHCDEHLGLRGAHDLLLTPSERFCQNRATPLQAGCSAAVRSLRALCGPRTLQLKNVLVRSLFRCCPTNLLQLDERCRECLETDSLLTPAERSVGTRQGQGRGYRKGG